MIFAESMPAAKIFDLVGDGASSKGRRGDGANSRAPVLTSGLDSDKNAKTVFAFFVAAGRSSSGDERFTSRFTTVVSSSVCVSWGTFSLAGGFFAFTNTLSWSDLAACRGLLNGFLANCLYSIHEIIEAQDAYVLVVLTFAVKHLFGRVNV
jgi:hypothetical protein